MRRSAFLAFAGALAIGAAGCGGGGSKTVVVNHTTSVSTPTTDTSTASTSVPTSVPATTTTSTTPSTTPAQDRILIEQTVRDFFNSARNGNAAHWCGQQSDRRLKHFF